MKRIVILTLGLLVSTLFLTPTYSLVIAGTGATLEKPVYAVIHYLRDDGNYGDHTTGNYNDFWGLHLWGDAEELTEWPAPEPFLGEDEYGRFAWVKLASDATNVSFIVHRGDAKDGDGTDRFFDPGVNPEIWLRNGDANTYASQAEAQGFVTVHYHRDDGVYGNLASGDYNDFWGLHLWGEAVDPSEETGWEEPKKPTGIDDFGAFWDVLIVDASQPVEFIAHRGDLRDPGPDQSFVPLEDATIWLQSGVETIYSQRGAAENVAILHYHRPDGDYGDPSSLDFNDFWGLHVWTGAFPPVVSWNDPIRPDSFDIFGPVFKVSLVEGAHELAYILHWGDEKDPGPDQFLDFGTYGYEVWQLEGTDPERPYILPQLTVLTVPEAIHEVVNEVENLVADGDLNQGQGKALLRKLNNAIKQLDQGKTAGALDKLQAVIDQVSDFMSEGILAPEEGQALIDAVGKIIDAING
ncbi:MAG TPA: pullulanase-associated domain-containing protein [Acidobacteriota bacterium]|nr:pullulanase-associated domain-containing protein [Acidobacteriota bacterium]